VDRHERLLAAGDPRQIEALWQRVHDRVFMQAIPPVPVAGMRHLSVFRVRSALISIKIVSEGNERRLRNGAGCAPAIGPACTSGSGERPRSQLPLGIMKQGSLWCTRRAF
jgi:hypothetical protein